MKITGVLDTARLFDGLLGQLGTAGAGPMPDLSDMLGDTRARSSTFRRDDAAAVGAHRPQHAGRGRAGRHASRLRITNVNEPVEVPDPGA